MTPAEMAKYIDHTVLKPDATPDTIRNLCAEARNHGFISVCINPVYVPLAADELAGTDVKVCTVVGFPLGSNTTSIKVAETKQAIADGATEIDMVIHVGNLKAGEHDAVKQDIHEVANACSQGGALLKVIIETAFLTDEEKVRACELSKAAGADYVKTSTGFAASGATVEDIALMRKTVGPDMGVKASGGVRTTDDALAMINAGASRIGASAGIAILQGL